MSTGTVVACVGAALRAALTAWLDTAAGRGAAVPILPGPPARPGESSPSHAHGELHLVLARLAPSSEIRAAAAPAPGRDAVAHAGVLAGVDLHYLLWAQPTVEGERLVGLAYDWMQCHPVHEISCARPAQAGPGSDPWRIEVTVESLTLEQVAALWQAFSVPGHPVVAMIARARHVGAQDGRRGTHVTHPAQSSSRTIPSAGSSG